jgi:hypothetical protein
MRALVGSKQTPPTMGFTPMRFEDDLVARLQCRFYADKPALRAGYDP